MHAPGILLIILQYLPTNRSPKEDKTATNPKYTAYISLAKREFDTACTDSPESLVIDFFVLQAGETQTILSNDRWLRYT